ncbi:MAG: hypothetical protein V1843_05060 [bacterium]
MRKQNGNIILTFILLIALSAFTTVFLFMISGNLRQLGSQVNYEKSFYIAEAGAEKALWYLKTPVADGGMGESWRTTGLTESFGGGQYTISVADSATGTVVIMVTGEALGTSRAVGTELRPGTPSAFNYTVFADGNFSVAKDSEISGTIFVNGNTSIASGCSLGTIYHPSGTSISGSGYIDGGEPSPLPTMPTLNTTSYDNAIAIANTYAAGDVSYNDDFSLGGGTTYVNGNINFTKDLIITGPGTLVVSGNINMAKNITVTGGEVNLISGGSFSASKDFSLSNTNVYAATSINLAKDVSAGGMSALSLITPGSISISKDPNLTAFIYAGGSASIAKDAVIHGSLVTGTLSLAKDIALSYQDVGDVPAVFSGNLVEIPGGWKEY